MGRRPPLPLRRKRLIFAGLTALSVWGALVASVACNAIIGVEDVKLKKNRDSDLKEDADIFVPLPIEEGGTERLNVFQTALGESHTCARRPEGSVKCWGADDFGQTGSGGNADGGIVITPVDVASVNDAIDIASGRNHTCVARRDGTVSCWGSNVAGQLGNGESGNEKPTPVNVMGLKAVAVAAGGDFSCAIRPQGTAACWGGNGTGQLGRGDQLDSTIPVAVADVTDAVAISAGQKHACAVKSDGTVLCWGDGSIGQLGYGSTDNKNRPVVVDALPAAVMVATSERSTCALTRTGSVYCWGANELGQLGTGASNTTPNPAPIIVTNLSDAAWIGSGRNHTCAVRKGGSVVCWGAGPRGQLGDGQPRPDAGGAQASYVQVSGLQTAVSVGGGGDHSCAPTKTNAILCWGANTRGQLGNGSLNSELSPVSVSGYP